jgi:hypothetical protein
MSAVATSTIETRIPSRLDRRCWGPGVFCAALREALEEGVIRRPSRTTFAARESQSDHESGGDG